MPTWQPVALRDGQGRTYESLPASLASALCSDVEAIPTEGQPLPWLHSGCKGRSFHKVTQYAVLPNVMVACFGTRQQFDPVARKVGFLTVSRAVLAGGCLDWLVSAAQGTR